MNKTTRMLSAAGSAVLALGLMALPALASGSPQNSASGWFTQMQSYMNQTFTPAQHQQLINSSAMQSLHNSSAMQQAMQSGDIGTMQSLMNSDSALKAQIGQDNINRMNGFMNSVESGTGVQTPSAPRTKRGPEFSGPIH